MLPSKVKIPDNQLPDDYAKMKIVAGELGYEEKGDYLVLKAAYRMTCYDLPIRKK